MENCFSQKLLRDGISTFFIAIEENQFIICNWDSLYIWKFLNYTEKSLNLQKLFCPELLQKKIICKISDNCQAEIQEGLLFGQNIDLLNNT